MALSQNPSSANSREILTIPLKNRIHSLARKTLTALVFFVASKVMSQIETGNPNRPEGKEVFFNVAYHFNPEANANYTDTYKKDNVQDNLAMLYRGLQSSNTFKYTFGRAKFYDMPLIGSGDAIDDLANFGQYVQVPENGFDKYGDLHLGIFGEPGYQERTAIASPVSTGVISTSFSSETILGHALGHMAGVNPTHDGTLHDLKAYSDYGAGFTDLEEFDSLGSNFGQYAPLFSVDPSDVNLQEDGYFHFNTLTGGQHSRVTSQEMDGDGEDTMTKLSNLVTQHPEKWQTRDKEKPTTPIIELSGTAEGGNDIVVVNTIAVNDNHFESIESDPSYKIAHKPVVYCLYLASNTSNNAQIMESVDGNFTDAPVGNYIVMAYSPSTNQRTEVSNTVNITTLGVENNSIQGLKLYPNPSSGIINLEYDGNEVIQSVEISNQLGQKVRVNDFTSGTIDITNFANGLYFIKVQTESGKTQTFKHLKE